MRLTIGKKLGGAFGTIIILMLISAAIALVNFQRVNRTAESAIFETYPALVSCERLMSDLNRTLAALRGGLILDDNAEQLRRVKAERQEAWIAIEQTAQDLAEYARASNDEQDQRDLATILATLDELETLQQEIEDVAHTEENIPAHQLTMGQAQPQATQMLAALTAVIDIESQQIASSERRDLLKALADSRATIVTSAANIHLFVFSGNPEFATLFEADWSANTDAYKRAIASQDLLTSEQRRHWERYAALHSAFEPLARRIMDLRRADDWNKAEYLLETSAIPLVANLRSTIDELINSAHQHVEQDRQDVATASTRAVALVIGATLVATILGLIVAVMLSRQIGMAIQALADRANAVASGDLTGGHIVVAVNDEIGDLADRFNQMTDSLRDLTGQIGAVSGNIDSASNQILAATKQQSGGTREQAASVQQVFSTMKELSQSGEQISDKAKQVASSAEATTSAAMSGQDTAVSANKTMTAIREQVEQVAQNIVALSEKTQTIGEIITTVNDIAEQSNLLALNASIEAVSAGEQGGRFTVVANEMKNLADQAKESTVQVREILSDVQKGINTAVMLTEEAVKRADSGKKQADVTEQTIVEMGQTTTRSVEAFQQIVAGTTQQQVGFDQVTQGMGNITEAADQIATSTNQLESAAANLTALSKQLNGTIERYRI